MSEMVGKPTISRHFEFKPLPDASGDKACMGGFHPILFKSRIWQTT